MSNSYVLLEKIVVGSAGASSVTFANIPQTGYTDLKVVMSARNTASASNWYTLKLQFNSDTTDGNYSTRILYGFGSTAGSGTGNRQNTGYITSDARTANTFNNLEMYIPNYAGSTNKSFSVDSVTEGNGSSFEILGLHAGLWSSTAAITQIVLAPDAGNFAANSTFYLYGVAKLGTTPTIAPKATGGDVIDTDGTYWYHIFRSSGTFRPATALTCDYLVVAGGGGGGASDLATTNWGGGGGAGGYRTTVGTSGGGGAAESPLSLTAQAYTVTVGAGGSGVASAPSNGTNSVFSTITSTGGGYGSGLNLTPAWYAAAVGGSGGGGSEGNNPGAAGTANQGYAGGTVTVNNASGGGGGAGGVGASPTSGTTGGAGGAGITSSISGTSVARAGGGAGAGTSPGTATAGGGAASSSTTGSDGTANTGGGGGSGTRNGGNGGSGIVVVRYLVA
jgi:hypothetical protein